MKIAQLQANNLDMKQKIKDKESLPKQDPVLYQRNIAWF